MDEGELFLCSVTIETLASTLRNAAGVVVDVLRHVQDVGVEVVRNAQGVGEDD